MHPKDTVYVLLFLSEPKHTALDTAGGASSCALGGALQEEARSDQAPGTAVLCVEIMRIFLHLSFNLANKHGTFSYVTFSRLTLQAGVLHSRE